MMLNLAFFGDLTVDNYKTLNRVKLGGASLNQAIWAKRLKQQPTIIAAIGNDQLGRKYQKYFHKEKIKTDLVSVGKGKTSQIEITLNKNGERFFGNWQPGVLKKYHLDKIIKDFLQTQDAVCLPVYFPTKHLLSEVVKIKRSPDNSHWSSVISKKTKDQRPKTNCQQLIAKSHKPLIVADFDDLSQFNKKTDFLKKYLPFLDLVFVGLDKKNDKILMEKISQLSRKYHKLIVVTLNKEGSWAFDGGKKYTQKAKKVQVVDTTGGGDAFLVGFLIEYLETKNIKKSLIKGTNLAVRAISRIGAH